ncbi:hypothetical protein LTR62_008895 [Meristemomyces frigidus]|uniref:Meiotically up-regulated gene 154 protein n=1 Tax=Meristemomyces frigidus TaxID=1508187 RepID=A0AAN7TAE8_9PEZI|nr:hypothetical protein LTR62_008895 [Meristemomyces frigidus]
MPRLVRRAPLIDRVKAYLDPYDILLWLAEELNDDAFEEWMKSWATPIGIALNLVFVLARGLSKAGQARGRDDVFGDIEAGRGSGWLTWVATFLVQLIALFCFFNAVYTFSRKRKYRLFEQPIDIAPATPSAHRVRVGSSPMTTSPLRFLQGVIKNASAAGSRAYPDAEREVWELGIWDPKPAGLTIFTLFSPGHVLLYFALLPPAAMDPRPSVTVFTALAFGALFSVQLGLLETSFSQQAKDSALVHGEVLNEYDTKFVRPSLNRPVRDVGIQTRENTQTPGGTSTREVDVYTPTTIVNRGFRVNPNTNYASQYNPDHLTTPTDGPARQPVSQLQGTSPLTTPTTNGTYVNGYTQSTYSRPSTAGLPDFSSPLKPHHERLRERSPAKGDGGSMGIYSHAASPLRKAASSGILRRPDEGGRAASPLKRVSMTPGGGAERDGGARRRETGRF